MGAMLLCVASVDIVDPWVRVLDIRGLRERPDLKLYVGAVGAARVGCLLLAVFPIRFAVCCNYMVMRRLTVMIFHNVCFVGLAVFKIRRKIPRDVR